MDIGTFIGLVKTEYSRWQALLNQVDPALMEQPGADGEMSIKDMIAHISWYERQMVNVMESRNFVQSPLWDEPLDKRNKMIMDQNHARPLEDVLAESQLVHQALLANLQNFSTEDLFDPRRINGMPEDWIPWQVVASNTYEHYQEHAQDLKAWLER